MNVAERRGSPVIAMLLALALSAGLGATLSRGASAASPMATHCPGPETSRQVVRSELYFGLSRPHGRIGESEFAQFVERQVTPRFPHGLTLLGGSGQFRDASGSLVAEDAKLLILLHAADDAEASSKIEQIRDEYKRHFEQQSVLRADSVSCVSF
jgi:hypothetical protein